MISESNKVYLRLVNTIVFLLMHAALNSQNVLQFLKILSLEFIPCQNAMINSNTEISKTKIYSYLYIRQAVVDKS